MRILHPTTRVLCLVAGAVLVAGCGSSGGPTTAAPTSESTSPTAAPSRPLPAPVPPTASTTVQPQPQPTGPARARTSDLSAELAWVEGAAGSRYSAIVLTNRSRRTSTIYGYGGLQLLDARGRTVPTRQVRDRTTRPTQVVLRPGMSAHADMHWSAVAQGADSPTGRCQPEPAFLLVTPPDETRSLRIPWNAGPVCAQGLIIQGPYTAGRPGQAGTGSASVPGAVVAVARPGGGSGEVAVGWAAVPRATGYRVVRTTAGGAQLRVVADFDITTGRATAAPEVVNVWSAQHSYVPDRGRLAQVDRSPRFEYVDVGAGRRYYRVLAYNSAGNGPLSAVTGALPPGGTG
ncbi:MAG TPA: DUF4232 domain-containing protein [Mycobacteriales bacterium]